MAVNDDRAILDWAANTEPDLAGYIIYYGTAPGVYLTNVSVGLVTTYTVQQGVASVNFTQDGLWYFSIVAFDTSGNISPPATPVSKRIIRTHNKLKRRK